MYATPIEAEERLGELVEAVGDHGEIEITHETNQEGRLEASVIRVYGLSIADNVEHLIAHYGFLISPVSYDQEGISIFKRIFVDY